MTRPSFPSEGEAAMTEAEIRRKIEGMKKMKPITDEVIQRMARRIVRRFKPERIILFGSRARGDATPDSDVDLLVVMDVPDGNMAARLAVSHSLSPHPFGLDILVRSQSQIDERLALDDWFLEEITTKGKVLYARTDQGMGRKSRSRLRGRSTPARARRKAAQ